MMKRIMCYSMVVLVAALMLSPQQLNATARSASYECEGNACSVTTLTWNQDRQQFKVENSSAQQVKVTVTTFAGSSSVIIEPHKENYLEVKTFNGPYQAVYHQ
jgi:hypothetical protein